MMNDNSMIYSSEREILQTALSWLSEDHRVSLVTVLKTWGSSPRPAGSLMLIRDDGVHLGSISGGCVEEDLLRRVQHNEIFNNDDDLVTSIAYGSTRQEANRLSLPCGGRLELLVESLHNPTQLQIILDNIIAGKLISRRVCLNTGEISLHPAKPMDEFSYSEQTAHKVFGPVWQLLVIGAGHLSQYVAQLAIMLDYKVNVCDPREEYQREEYQQVWAAKGIEVMTTMPDEAVNQIGGSQRSIILALSHDPKQDDLALLQALEADCFYVGALGSQGNNDARRLRLKELGLTHQQLQKLHGPVGLPIGSHTPAEIAVSIMAEITAVRNSSNTRQHVPHDISVA